MSDQSAALLDEQAINRIVEERIRNAGFVTREELNQRIADAEQRAGDHANQLVGQAIAAAEGRLNGVLIQVQQSITTLTNEWRTASNTLTNEWRLWRGAADEKFQARSEQMTTLQQTVNRHDTAIGEFQEQQSQNVADIRKLVATIHGDPELKDGAPSLYGMVEGISTKLTLTIPAWQSMMETRATEMIGRIEIIEAKEQTRKALWERRKNLVLTCWGWVNKTRWFQGILALIVFVIISHFLPTDWIAQIRALFLP